MTKPQKPSNAAWSNTTPACDADVHAWLYSLFSHSLNAVHGTSLVRKALPKYTPLLHPVNGGRCVVMAIGKAAGAMAEGLQEAVEAGECKPWNRAFGLSKAGWGRGPITWGWQCAAHPVPDRNSVEAGKSLLRVASSLRTEDRLLLLLSGGASSLACAPAQGLAWTDKAAISRALIASGAPIHEINQVRRCLSAFKDGGLRRAAGLAMVTTLAISDVPGDVPSVIGSGPTALAAWERHPDDPIYCSRETQLAKALALLSAYGLDDAVPAVTSWLRGALKAAKEQRGVVYKAQEERVFLLASNRQWMEACASLAQGAGVEVSQPNGTMNRTLAELQEEICAVVMQPPPSRPQLWLWGGEPTLQVTGEGRGGRMQHLALSMCASLAQSRCWLLAGASDGNDGPTPAAGAIVGPETWARAHVSGISMASALRHCDSYAFHRRMSTLITSQKTVTNVCDLVILLRLPVPCP